MNLLGSPPHQATYTYRTCAGSITRLCRRHPILCVGPSVRHLCASLDWPSTWRAIQIRSLPPSLYEGCHAGSTLATLLRQQTSVCQHETTLCWQPIIAWCLNTSQKRHHQVVCLALYRYRHTITSIAAQSAWSLRAEVADDRQHLLSNRQKCKRWNTKLCSISYASVDDAFRFIATLGPPHPTAQG